MRTVEPEMSSRGRNGTGAEACSNADDGLVDRAVAGDREAFGAILRRHDRQLRGLASKLLAGDEHRMDDVLQDAYLHAYCALPRFRHDAQIGTWLYRITYNACIDELRRAARRPNPVDIADTRWDRPAAGSDPDAAAVTTDVTVRALAVLPPDQRVAVVLVDGEGFDHKSAARILGVPLGTLASRLSRGRARLRHLIGEDSS